jgi:preprotein translocase subunit YajC
MVLSLQQGDEVITSAGIYGTIIDLDDEVVSLEVAEGVRLRIARMAIGRRLTPHPEDFGTEAPPPPAAIEDEAGQALPPPADEQ